jgi:hypothetical protein
VKSIQRKTILVCRCLQCNAVWHVTAERNRQPREGAIQKANYWTHPAPKPFL